MMLHPFSLGKNLNLRLAIRSCRSPLKKKSHPQVAPKGVFTKAILREQFMGVATSTVATQGARDGTGKATKPREDRKRNDW